MDNLEPTGNLTRVSFDAWLWEESRVPVGSPHNFRKTMQNPNRKVPGGIWTRTTFFWFHSTIAFMRCTQSAYSIQDKFQFNNMTVYKLEASKHC